MPLVNQHQLTDEYGYLVAMSHLVRESYDKGLHTLTEEERHIVRRYLGFDAAYHNQVAPRPPKEGCCQ